MSSLFRPRGRRFSIALALFTGVVSIAALITAPTAGAAPAAGSAPRWLCSPALSNDPCDLPGDTTDLRTRVATTPKALSEADKPVDCFYVYPTVSNQVSLTADRVASPEVKSIARFQAARFNSGCRVFAPVYRQIPLLGLSTQLLGATNTRDAGYSDVLAAWKQYLAEDNKGRGVILIGHSQGSLTLRRLIREQIDTTPAVRSRLVGAFLMGGNVETARGKTTGGDFKNVPLCTLRGQKGCVVAYSTTQTDPSVSLFGSSALDRLSASFGLPSGPAFQVACTDPAVLSGDRRPVGVTVPSQPYSFGFISVLLDYTTFPFGLPTSRSSWTTSAQRATGRCIDKNGYRFYQFHVLDGAPAINEIPLFNGHLVDMNLGYDRLVSIARQMTASWLAAR